MTPYARTPAGEPIEFQTDAEGNLKSSLATLPGLDIPAHDYIAMTYTGSDLTGVVYKTGGSGGTTVATLTLAYTDGNLTSVAKS